MSKRSYYIVSWVIILICTACSTQKNTRATRAYHQTKVKYNIFYNGNLAYQEGLQAIDDAVEDDYTGVLNLYPVSNPQAAQAATSQMDRTIEKCRKCIKLHSIKSRPKADPRKSGDPAYKQWLKREEFNEEMGNVWIRLGEAEFHKGDFMGSIGTFSYVIRHYEYDPDIVARCQLWIARAYAEMGWMYEAEDMLDKVAVDALARKNAWQYSAVSADILLKNKRYHEAIPFVKIALPHEKRKIYRPRFQYVLAQLYEQEGKRSEAVDAYAAVLRLAPDATMEFNARLHKAALQGKSAVRSLEKMAKLAKNKDHQDQIYGVVGDIYLSDKDTTRALDFYQKAIESSTQPSLAKASILVRAGDLYYDRRDYAASQPLYQEAITILSSESDDYRRIQQRSEALDELIIELQTVELQDSLQRLAKMSEEEQRAIVDKIIAQLLEQEAHEAELAAQAEREAQQDNGLQSVNTRNMLGGGGMAAEWYFYNKQLLSSGKQEFARRWGNRPLEDHWRRRSKSPNMSFVEEQIEGEEQDSLSSDSTVLAVQEVDIHKPEYYLQQIPRTQEDLRLSDSLIASSLCNLVYIYQDKVSDVALSEETLQTLSTRFPQEKRLADLYYMKYLDCLKHEDQSGAQHYRQLIMDGFPESQQAYIVSQPDYFTQLRRMASEQDSLYAATYQAYTRADYHMVKENASYARQAYPLSPLMPRFLFLRSIALARTEGQDAFVTSLRDLVTSYPESELGAMAKDMLAMMGQGMESQKGTSATSLADLRGQVSSTVEDTLVERSLSAERRVTSYVLLMLDAEKTEADRNQLLYQTALFNFSQFMIRDFELQPIPHLASGSALRVAGFDSMDEAEWYIDLIQKNADFNAYLQSLQVVPVAITEENLPLLGTQYTLEQYLSFSAH